jgi:hypothetical protein
VSLLDEVLEAHGGRERWAGARRVRARIRSGGLLPQTRARQLLGGALLEIGIGEPRGSAIADADPGHRAVFDHGEVRIETLDGEVLESRRDPRAMFFGRSGLRRNVRWDDLDATYFAGYAWWNYLNHPYLLTHEGMRVRELATWRQDDETWRRLEARFPAGLDTHSPLQVFYYDRELRLRRHDYTADVIGGLARAAHLCADHAEVGGLLFPTRRRVMPRGPGNRPLPFPTLVALHLSEIEVE